MAHPIIRDLPLVLTLKNLLPLEDLVLAGVTKVPRGGTITFELFKVHEAKRTVAYQAILNCQKAKCLEIVDCKWPDYNAAPAAAPAPVPAPPVQVSSPTSSAGSAEQDVQKDPLAAGALAETAPVAGLAEIVPVPAVEPVVEAPVAPDLTAGLAEIASVPEVPAAVEVVTAVEIVTAAAVVDPAAAPAVVTSVPAIVDPAAGPATVTVTPAVVGEAEVLAPASPESIVVPSAPLPPLPTSGSFADL